MVGLLESSGWTVEAEAGGRIAQQSIGSIVELAHLWVRVIERLAHTHRLRTLPRKHPGHGGAGGHHQHPHFTTAAALVSPAPNATNSRLSPSFTRPASTASQSAIGMDA